jgi:hypothetical protein
MKKVTANQPFYGSRDEKQWNIGDTREVSDERAVELEKAGLVSDPEEHTAAMAAQNKVLDDAADKATTDKLKKLSDELKKTSDAAKLDKAQREKEAKELAERQTKEEKEPLQTKTEA